MHENNLYESFSYKVHSTHTKDDGDAEKQFTNSITV